MSNQLDELFSSAGFSLVYVSCGIKDELKKEFATKGHDITLDQFSVMLRLWEEDGLSQSELCEKTMKTKSNLTRILDSMEKKGLIYRQVKSGDRRSFSIFLSEKGMSMKEDLILAAIQANEKIFKGINEVEKDTLRKSLNTITQNLNRV